MVLITTKFRILLRQIKAAYILTWKRVWKLEPTPQSMKTLSPPPPAKSGAPADEVIQLIEASSVFPESGSRANSPLAPPIPVADSGASYQSNPRIALGAGFYDANLPDAMHPSLGNGSLLASILVFLCVLLLASLFLMATKFKKDIIDTQSLAHTKLKKEIIDTQSLAHTKLKKDIIDTQSLAHTKLKKEIIEAHRKDLFEQRKEINEAREYDLSEQKKAHETLADTIDTMQEALSAIQVTVSTSQGSLSMSQSTISATLSRMQQTVSDMQATTVAVQATISGLQTTIATSQDFRSAVQETLFLMQATQSAIQETLSSMRVTQSTVQETLSSMQETLLGFSESSTRSPVYPTLQPVVGDSLASHSASTRFPRLSTGTSASDDILRNRRIPSAKPLSLAAIGKLKESTGDVQLRVKSGRPKTGSVSTNRSTTLATVQEATVADETEVAGWEDLDSSDYQDFVEENSQPEVGLVNVRTALYESLTAGPV